MILYNLLVFLTWFNKLEPLGKSNTFFFANLHGVQLTRSLFHERGGGGRKTWAFSIKK